MFIKETFDFFNFSAFFALNKGKRFPVHVLDTHCWRSKIIMWYILGSIGMPIWSLQTNTVLQGWRKVSITGGAIIKSFPDNMGHYLANLTKSGGLVPPDPHGFATPVL